MATVKRAVHSFPSSRPRAVARSPITHSESQMNKDQEYNRHGAAMHFMLHVSTTQFKAISTTARNDST